MYRVEFAKVYDGYLKNRRQFENLQTMQRSSLQVLVSQELMLGGMESEYCVKRISRIPFGEDAQPVDPEELESQILNKDISMQSIISENMERQSSAQELNRKGSNASGSVTVERLDTQSPDTGTNK